MANVLKIVRKISQMIVFVDWIKIIAISMKLALIIQMLKKFVYLGGWLFARLARNIAIVESIKLCVEKTLTAKIRSPKRDYVWNFVYLLESLTVLVELFNTHFARQKHFVLILET